MSADDAPATYVYCNARTRFEHTAAAYVVSHVVSHVISALHSERSERGIAALTLAQQSCFQVVEADGRLESPTHEAALLAGRKA